MYEVGEILKNTDILYAVDVAQTAGSELLDFQELHCDYLAFTGHKGLLGPPGIGGFCISDRAVAQTNSLVEGGTGSRSEDEHQPLFLPDKYESGTQNVPGIAGLAAGVRELTSAGLTKVKRHKTELTSAFLSGLTAISEITVYGTKNSINSSGVVSLNLLGLDNGDLSFMLEQAYGIMTRSGLHCAPLAHKTIGSFPAGTCRFSFGMNNTLTDVEDILFALQTIVKESK